MRYRGRIFFAALLIASVCMGSAAQAAEKVTIHASLSPNKLGVPTNLATTASFSSDVPGSQPPMTKVTAYAPAGMSVDVHGAGVCTATPQKLEEVGPQVCPADSRIGFGKAGGLEELGGELVPGPFTLEFFLRPREGGHLALLIYVNAVTPATEQIAFTAKEVRAPKPYGMGITFAVPIVQGLPGAPLGWVDHLLVTFGSAHVTYRKVVHGKRELVHVRGLIAPRTCPHGGFPVGGSFEFADGSTTTSETTIPCPHR